MQTKNLINSVILFLGIVFIASGQKQNTQATPPPPPGLIYLFSGSDRQTVCENSPISNITYGNAPQFVTSVSGLPSGVTWSILSDQLTISGTPFTAGSYNYLVSDGYTQLTGMITVTAKTTPIFSQLTPINSGGTLAVLPTTSTNGITGTWLPAPNNTATTTYTFTPSVGQCANTTTMTVAVNTVATPTQNLCSRDTQTYSVNTTDSSHAGSIYAWSISPTIPNIVITGQGTNSITIDWSNAPYGSYTLQAVETNGASCVSTPVNATINLTQPATAPSAAATQTFCTAATVANLTATGTNLQWFTAATGGTALTATTALTTGNYYVSQTVGLCESNRTVVAVAVNPTVVPTFTQVSPICSGGILSSLPTTSNNGITGTWLPAINNTATTNYTFTPTAGLCAATTAMTIVVNQNVTPTFTQVAPICSGGILASLPTTSNNGITGTWLPAINNTATTNYTFTPTVGLCAATAAMTIVVNPNVTPTFTQISPVCSGTTLTALPTTSNNGITGTWLPAVNPNITTTYTFTPTAGQCASTTTQTIIITAPVVTSPISFVAPVQQLSVGMSYGGGKIIYIFQPGDAGYINGQTHGLIIAIGSITTTNTGNNCGSYFSTFGCSGVFNGNTSTAMGTGISNTNQLVASCGAGTVASICDSLVENGYSDWFLPSKDELSKVYQNYSLVGGVYPTASQGVWSSSEVNANSGYVCSFDGGGGWVVLPKTYGFCVKPLRKF